MSDQKTLETIRDEFLYWLLSVELAAYPTSAPVAELYRRRLAGDEPSREEWHAAARDARAVAASAADDADAAAAAAAYAAADAAAAARAAYRAAARDAAAAAAAAAASAAYSASAASRADRAGGAACAAARHSIATELLRLLRAAGFDPLTEDLHRQVASAVEEDGSRLDMSIWHCGTSHCRAGWAVTLAPIGKQLEAVFGTELAGRVIYLASTGTFPDFFASQNEALADIRRCAGL